MPSSAADDDRASAFESVDFARDDSFRAVLAFIRNFHDMGEPAGVPSARCKTSLASAFGLVSEVSPAFTLPTSPLLRTLLDDINLALSKFLEDQTVHGFLPVPPLLDGGRCYPGVLSGACRLALLGLWCLWVPRSCGVNGLRDGDTCLRSGLWSSSVHDRNEAFPSFWWVWFLTFVRGSLPQAGAVFFGMC